MLLMILRHGKAEKEAPSRRDADRALAERGRRQAEFIGETLAKAKPPLVRPAIVLSSRAERAKATAVIVAEALGLPVQFDDGLALGSSPQSLLSLMRRMFKTSETVLIVGHNPQLESLVSVLAGTDHGLRTGELVCVDASFPSILNNQVVGEVARIRLEDD